VARSRNIKPGLFKNEVLGVADPLYTLLFEGLWLLADRAGRLENRPLRIKAEVFPYREGLDVVAMLSWLESNGFIRRYQANGLALIQIVEFVKHQNPHKNEPESLLPAPDEIGASTEKIGSTRADSGFLIPDSGFLITDMPPAASPPPPAKSKKQKTELPDGFAVSDRVRKWAAEKGYERLEEHCEAFVRKCQSNGYRKLDWDATFMEAIREDWAKLRGRAGQGAAPAGERSTVQAHASSGDALKKIEADRSKAVPMPADIRAKLDAVIRAKTVS
jgi:hypothetical protein